MFPVIECSPPLNRKLGQISFTRSFDNYPALSVPGTKANGTQSARKMT